MLTDPFKPLNKQIYGVVHAWLQLKHFRRRVNASDGSCGLVVPLFVTRAEHSWYNDTIRHDVCHGVEFALPRRKYGIEVRHASLRLTFLHDGLVENTTFTSSG